MQKTCTDDLGNDDGFDDEKDNDIKKKKLILNNGDENLKDIKSNYKELNGDDCDADIDEQEKDMYEDADDTYGVDNIYKLFKKTDYDMKKIMQSGGDIIST